MKALLLGWALMLLSVVAAAQDNSFKVLAMKGICLMNREGDPSDKWSAISTGGKLDATVKVLLIDGSYLGLVAQGGKTMELKKPGVYSINDLSVKMESSNTSFAAKYLEFMMADMNASATNQRKHMGITGSVERSTEEAAKIMAYSPGRAAIIKENTQICWNKHKGQSAYKVVITDMFDDQIFAKEVSDTNCVINFSDMQIEDEEVYILQIRSTADEKIFSKKIELTVPELERIKMISDTLNLIKSGISMDNALHCLILGTYFEKNELYLNALQYYQKAIALSPGVENYENAYRKLLFRLGLITREKIAAKN